MGKYGRRLYFNTSNGDILYDTGEMEGDIIRSSILDEIALLNLEGKYPEDVDCIEIPYGEMTQEFSEKRFFRINIKNRQVYFHGDSSLQKKYYNQQEVRQVYTKEDILRFYHEHYINFNLKQLINDDPTYSFNWYTLDEIDIRPEILEKSWYYYYHDDYINNTATDRTQLGQDILDNGTYWPLVVTKVAETGKIVVYEGNHRIISAKLLQLEGKWDNTKKLLCMEMDEDQYKKFKGEASMSVYTQFKMPNSIVQRVPFVVMFGSTTSLDDEEVKTRMERANILLVDEDTVEFEINAYNELISASQTYPHWLRDIFFNYKTINNEMIQPSPIINDYQAWCDWLLSFESPGV